MITGGGTKGGGADRRPVTGGRLDEAALALGAEPVAVAADRQHVAVVQQPVEDGGRHDRIGEHGAPLGNAAVRTFGDVAVGWPLRARW